MSLPKLILRRNEERLRAKAFEVLSKAKLIEEITEAVRLLNLEVQEEKKALSELMAKMKELAASLDEVLPVEGGSHLQRALRDAAQALGESQLRLPSEIGILLTKGDDAERSAGDGGPSAYFKREVVMKAKDAAPAERNSKEDDAAPLVSEKSTSEKS